MKNYYVIILSILLVSCSTTQNSNKELKTNNFKNKLVENIELKANIIYSSENSTQQIDSKIKLIGYDSLGISLIGPLGINLGKGFANGLGMNFFSVFENRIYQLAFNAGIFQGTNFNFFEFMSIFRGFDASYFQACTIQKSENLKDNEILFIKKFENNIDFYKIDKKTNNLIQWQRKDLNNNTIINLTYESYTDFENPEVPKLIYATIPNNNTKVTIEVKSIKKLNFEEIKVSFDKPSSAEIINIK